MMFSKAKQEFSTLQSKICQGREVITNVRILAIWTNNEDVTVLIIQQVRVFEHQAVDVLETVMK